jgi:hypothetical protein
VSSASGAIPELSMTCNSVAGGSVTSRTGWAARFAPGTIRVLPTALVPGRSTRRCGFASGQGASPQPSVTGSLPGSPLQAALPQAGSGK